MERVEFFFKAEANFNSPLLLTTLKLDTIITLLEGGVHY